MRLQLALDSGSLEQAFLNGTEVAAVDVKGLYRASPADLDAQRVRIGLDLDSDWA